jgi:acetyl esterase
MTSKLESDTRIDPRIKAYLAGKNLGGEPNVSSREELLAQEYCAAGPAAQTTSSLF